MAGFLTPPRGWCRGASVRRPSGAVTSQRCGGKFSSSSFRRPPLSGWEVGWIEKAPALTWFYDVNIFSSVHMPVEQRLFALGFPHNLVGSLFGTPTHSTRSCHLRCHDLGWARTQRSQRRTHRPIRDGVEAQWRCRDQNAALLRCGVWANQRASHGWCHLGPVWVLLNILSQVFEYHGPLVSQDFGYFDLISMIRE